MADNTKQVMVFKLLITETYACTFLLHYRYAVYGLRWLIGVASRPASLGALTQQLCGGVNLGRNEASAKEVISGLRDFCILDSSS